MAGHGACSGEVRNSYKIVVNKSERKRCLESLGINGKVILRLISQINLVICLFISLFTLQ
jgi:hypothetical protein